jgi:hypothetical protein
MLSPTQTFTEEQQSEPQMEKRKSKCHGNRKLQHFKRKCRVRGLTEEQLQHEFKIEIIQYLSNF